ncbi:MAG TPA: SpoIIE family protein phosphatase [Candidatus Polarisedimenticolia bacterium]|nr:SpoIIE family protein phosphatase [Candidatus Polarisedimenticolia bacterium]
MTRVVIDWAAASRPRPGESASGDRGLVVPLADGALVAAIDGLGHGPEAAEASDLAVRTIEAHADLALPDIVEHCHRRLQPTRGATLSLARWNGPRHALDWIGVGNVEGLVLRAAAPEGARVRLLLRSGLVGVHLPPLKVETVEVPGDGRLIFATDGIASDFDTDLDPREAVKAMADRILARSLKSADDAMVVVTRLAG